MSEIIKIRIMMGSKLGHIADPEKIEFHNFKTQLEKYLVTLIQDLSLPFEHSIEIETASSENKLLNLPYLVRVNEFRVKFRLNEIISLEDEFEYASHIISGIINDRNSLLTESLSNQIFENWMKTHSKFMQTLSKTEFYTILQFCINHGIPIYHFYEYMSRWKGKKDKMFTTRFFEHFLKSDTMGLEIFLNNRLHKETTIESVKKDLKIDQSDETFTHLLPLMEAGMFYELGMIYPSPKLSHDKSLSDIQVRFKFNEIQFPPVRALGENEYLINETTERLGLLDVEGVPILNPANRSEQSIITGTKDLEICEKAGLNSWNSNAFTILQLSSVMRRHSCMFFSLDTMKNLMDSFYEFFPALYESVLLHYTYTDLAEIFRQFIIDEISIRNLRELLERLLELRLIKQCYFDDHSRFIEETVRELRITQKRYISNKYIKAGRNLPVILLDSKFEEFLTDITEIKESDRMTVLQSIHAEKFDWNISQNPIILVSSNLRKKLQEMVRIEVPDIKIIAFEELDDNLNIYPISKLELIEFL